MASAILKAKYYDTVAKKSRHYHHCHQILFITKGTAEIGINDTLYKAERGSLIIFSKFEQHLVDINGGDYCRYVLEIDPNILTNAGSRYGIVSVLFNRPAGFFNILNVSDCMEEFEQVFARLVEEAKGRFLSTEMLDLIMQELLIMIWRRFPDVLDDISETGFNIVSKIQNRLETEYDKKFTLQGLSGEYCMSSSYLSHLFKEVTGSSVMNYLLYCRIAAAKKYLTDTRMSISDIVEKCGFSDWSNFTRTFRRVTGLTPSEFRKNYTNEN